MDLAQGHLKGLDKLDSLPGLVTYNLGTGNGYSVLEKAFSDASDKVIIQMDISEIISVKAFIYRM